jgi:hypothetical protein
VESDPKEIMELLTQLPGPISPETLLAEVTFALEIVQRLESLERGEPGFVSHDDVKKRFSGWPTSSGP